MNESMKLTLTDEFFAEHAEEIGKILQKAVAQALLMHKRLGNPIEFARTPDQRGQRNREVTLGGRLPGHSRDARRHGETMIPGCQRRAGQSGAWHGKRLS